MHRVGIACLFFGLLAFAAGGLPLRAESPDRVPQYTVRIWQTDDGLPQNSVQALCQTRDGYLWVGTQEGLARFDGVRFVPFDQKNVPELRSRFIMSLCEARDGSLWIGTDGGGVTVLKEGKFTHLGQSEGLVSDAVRVITATRDGAVWIGTTSGLSRYFNGRFRTFTTNEGLGYNVIRDLHEDAKGDLWIAASDCLSRWSNNSFTNWTMQNGLPDVTVRAVFTDKAGNVWIGSNNGITKFKDGVMTFMPKTEGLSGGFVVAMHEDRDRNLWLGGYSGLDIYRDGNISAEISDAGAFSALVYRICEDREGNIWVGSKEGLARFSRKRCQTYTKQQGLIDNTTVSVCSRRDGTLLIGTWGGGLAAYDGTNFTTVPVDHPRFNKLVLALHEAHDGSIWLGTDYNGGFFHLQNDGRVESFSELNGLIGNEVSVIYEDSRTNLWIGTRAGLNLMSESKFSFFSSTNGLPGNVVRTIVEDKSGALWIGTDGGLSQLKENRFQNFTTKDGLAQNFVVSLYEDDERTLWIGTRGGGLSRFRDGTFTTWTSAHGLFHDNIYQIIEDENGHLWMSGPKGVFVVGKTELENAARQNRRITLTSYGKADGMRSSECKGVAKPSGTRGQDGRFWFPTSKGLVSVDPAVKDTAKLPVYIEEVLVDGKTAEPAQKIISGAHQFTFHFTGLSFSSPEKIKFRYRLDGFDREWIDASNRREANYGQLPSGSYRFRVIAGNGDGVWNETGAATMLTVVPPVWGRWWFVASVVGVFVVILISAGHLISSMRMQRRVKALEHQNTIERERMRIARDMHDDLGGSLTQISLFSDMALRDLDQPSLAESHLRKISTSARQSVHALEEIVWAVHPGHDTLDGLVSYLCQFAEEFFRNTHVRCRVDVPAVLPVHPLSSELRHNLFLIVKEALNNALKYSGAAQVWLRVGCDDEHLTIAVEDNGRGFDLAEKSNAGNGLRNLERRAFDCGGRLEIESKPGCGTRIRVTIPLKSAKNQPSP